MISHKERKEKKKLEKVEIICWLFPSYNLKCITQSQICRDASTERKHKIIKRNNIGIKRALTLCIHRSKFHTIWVLQTASTVQLRFKERKFSKK